MLQTLGRPAEHEEIFAEAKMKICRDFPRHEISFETVIDAFCCVMIPNVFYLLPIIRTLTFKDPIENAVRQ